jgi:hypothetical protein
MGKSRKNRLAFCQRGGSIQAAVFGDSRRFTAVDETDSAMGNGFKPGKHIPGYSGLFPVRCAGRFPDLSLNSLLRTYLSPMATSL